MGSAFSRQEGFAVPLNDALTLVDTDLQAYFNSMSASDRAAYAQANVANVVANVMAVKADTFTSAYQRAVNQGQAYTNAATYKLSLTDLTTAKTDFSTLVGKQVNSATAQSALADRQYEINQWSNSNKLDTLYFLQILFICISFIASMAFLKSKGIVSLSLFALFSTIAGIIAILVLILRARYSSVIRDGRYWNKMKFPSVSTSTPVSASAT